MREILFRGQRQDTGEWVYGNLIVDGGATYIFVPPKHPKGKISFEPFVSYAVAPITAGQYTGLDDKNGQKIYEGDILAYYSDYRNETDIEGVVRYGNFNCSCCDGVYGWYVDGGDIRYLDGHASLHIIGNVHDNPKLLNSTRAV